MTELHVDGKRLWTTLHQLAQIGATEAGGVARVALTDADKAGRDHNKNAMTTWMAGGGTKGGVAHGRTDDIGLKAVEGRVSIPDWHATILDCLGLDHHKLVYNRNGLDERLTSVFEARVVKEILA